MSDSPSTVFWREVVSEGRASSYLVTECRPPFPRPVKTATVDDLVIGLAHAFFDGIAGCSGGLFDASYTEEPQAAGGPPLVRDAALHPRAVPWLPLLRLGAPRLLRSRDHAFIAYPVAGGPMAGRRGSGNRAPAGATGPVGAAEGYPGPGIPPGSGVWDLGALAFEVLRFEGSLWLSVLVCDYPPRLVGTGRSLARNALYRATQSPLHRLLVARFLRGAAATVTGVSDPGAYPPSRLSSNSS